MCDVSVFLKAETKLILTFFCLHGGLANFKFTCRTVFSTWKTKVRPVTWVRDAATTLGSIWNTYAISNVAVYFQAVSNFCPCRDSAITTMSLTGPVSPLEQLLQHKDDSFQVHLFSTKDLGSLAALNKSLKSYAMDNEHYQDLHRDYEHEQWLAWMNSQSNPYDFSD